MGGDTTRKDTQAEQVLFVVGVGASAGGLEALQRLFEKATRSGAFAFVVVQHLSPDFESVMGDLLAPHTPLTVVRAEQGMKLEPDHIYLMPPRHEMAVSDGHLTLTERDPGKGLFLPIDVFFRSLADDAGARAVGIVLSGTGSDGSRGVRAIHEAGGLVIAQDDTAKFDGMPRAAIETGTVDVVLPPEMMGGALTRYLEHDGRLNEVAEGSPDVLARLFELLRRESGIDFTGYKGSTVGRRIQRRLLLTHSEDLGQYLDRIAHDPTELRSLYCDLLIGVTRFFRDEAAFERLRTDVLPGLIDGLAAEEELRVWVAACATGEEPYSIAITISEEFRRRGREPAFRVFATDVHGASLEAASVGIYQLETVDHVPQPLRDLYFRPHRDGLQVSPDLRRHVVFAHHNLLKDAPFTRLDLVSCRNMLIYLSPAMQRKALGSFHFALKPAGVLLLGPSETPGSIGDEFAVIDSRWKLFRKIRDVRLSPEVRSVTTPQFETGLRPTGFRRPVEDARVTRGRELLIEAYGPPCLLVDADLKLLHSFNAASEFLTPKDGQPSLNVLDLVGGELRAVLSASIRRAQREGEPVVLDGLAIETAKGSRQVKLVVRSVGGSGRGDDVWVIALEPSAVAARDASHAPEERAEVGDLMAERVANLEGELRYAKENLQATIEEMETSNEELQATNEELIASNEELQSTNEELHSVNEELYTVNAEYQTKIAELTELTTDMNHLLEATEVHTLFVDRELRLRKFTPKIGDAFHLLPQDVGRRLDSFAHDLEDTNLLPDLEKTLVSGVTIEREVRDRSGRAYFLRILPYRRGGKVEGVVLTLIDLSALKRVQRDLAGVLEHSPAFIYLKDAEGRYLLAGRQSEDLLGVACQQIVGKTDHQLLPAGIAEARAACERRVIDSGKSQEREEQLTVGGLSRTFLTVVFPLCNPQGTPYAVAGISTDISEQKRASEEARSDVQRRDQFLAMLSHELRTPLGAILNATELLERNGAGASPSPHDVIRRQARHMGRLIDDLLDVGRITRQQLVLQQQIVDFREVVRDAIETVRRDAERKSLQLECKLPDEALTVRGDPVRLRQIVTNVMVNAVTYTTTGIVEVEAGRSNGTVGLQVRDTGIGLTADELGRVFDLFYQAPQPLDRPRGGLGVGLSLAQKLVSLHGGAIDVRSEGRDKGSVFCVSFPFAEAGPVLVQVGDGEPPKLRIVIVEDNDDNREMLAELLRSEGHEVWAASNGIEGTQLILDAKPDVALVDVGLPGLDGFGVAEKVREVVAGPIRLVALTGYGLPQDRARAADAGFDRHILKPVEPSVLFRVLREVAPSQDLPS